MKIPFDKIIVSSDDNPKFINFFPIVCLAWKKFFPDVIIDLCFVTDRKEDDIFIKNLRTHGNVYIYPVIKDVPQGNQGKVCRLYHASLQNELICSIHDIDTIPLQSNYLIDLLNLRKKGHFCLIGGECYTGIDKGKAPMVPTTAEGYLFKQLFNTENKDWNSFICSIKNIKVFDDKENILNSSDPIKNPDNYFSDESLLRVFIQDYKNNIQLLTRDAARTLNPYIHWIDRTYNNFNYDKNKLYEGFYTECNMPRPYDEIKMNDILNYLRT